MSKGSSSKRSSAGRSKTETRAARNRVIIIIMAVLMGLSLIAIPLTSVLQTFGSDPAPTIDDADPEAAEAEEAALAEGPGPCGETPDDAPTPDSDIYDEPFDRTIDESAEYTATIETTCGDVVIELHADAAPEAVNNLVNLAEEGYYQGVIFHRVVPGFVAQAGDPAGTGCGQEDCQNFDEDAPAYPGYTFDDELGLAEELFEQVREDALDQLLDGDAPEEGGLTEDLDEDELRELVPGGYPRGTLAMANAGPDTNGSQFFITQGEPTMLPGPQFTVFGTVVEGLDVIDDTVAAPTDQQDRPDEPTVILDIVIEQH